MSHVAGWMTRLHFSVETIFSSVCGYWYCASTIVSSRQCWFFTYRDKQLKSEIDHWPSALEYVELLLCSYMLSWCDGYLQAHLCLSLSFTQKCLKVDLEAHLLFRIQVFWDGTLCWLVNIYQRFKECSFFIAMGKKSKRSTSPALFLTCLTLKIRDYDPIKCQ